MLQSQEMLQLENAFVMINCESDFEYVIFEQLKTIEGVKESTRINGSYDIMARIESPTAESLKEIIDDKIRAIPHVRSTTTLIRSKYI